MIVLLACTLPPEEMDAPPSWGVSCESFDCPGADEIHYGTSSGYCVWDCATWEDRTSQTVLASFLWDGECWVEESVTISDGAWCGAW